MVYHMIQLISQCYKFASMIQAVNWTKAKQMYDLHASVVCVADVSKLPNFSVIHMSVCTDLITDMYP